MAAGYAQARPKLHGRILKLALGDACFGSALDLGCASGVSTVPLLSLAGRVFGVEPVFEMLPWAKLTAPEAIFVAGRAESLPFPAASLDLVAAAGSLNYSDVQAAFAGIWRVLRPGGRAVVYDFSQGKKLKDSAALAKWYESFKCRYPDPPPGSRTELDPDRLSAYGDRVKGECFQLGLAMSAVSYTAYAMTETNVAFAISQGHTEEAIRDWCRETLAEVFGKHEREVLFEGYYVCLIAPGVRSS